MKRSRALCGLSNKLAVLKSKAPSPTHLFGSPPMEDGIHNAIVDARITRSSFVQGRFRGYW